jgi:hypothetical protein
MRSSKLRRSWCSPAVGLGHQLFQAVAEPVIAAVMAQEVAEIVAEAARATSDGHLCMNCQKLGLRVLTWGRMHRGAGTGAAATTSGRLSARWHRVHSTLPFAIIPLLHDEASFNELPG